MTVTSVEKGIDVLQHQFQPDDLPAVLQGRKDVELVTPDGKFRVERIGNYVYFNYQRHDGNYNFSGRVKLKSKPFVS